MEHSQLSHHKFKKGKFITPFNELMQDVGKSSSWYYARMPEYFWLGLIINNGNRTTQMEKCARILRFMHEIDLNKKMDFPKMSLIFKLPIEKQKAIYEFMDKLQVLEPMKPLSVVFSDQSPLFMKYISGYTVPVHQRVQDLNIILENLTDQHSDLTTDVKFLVLYLFILTGKVHVGIDSVFPDIFSQYPYLSHDDPIMRMYRPSIRSAELAMSMNFGKNDLTNTEFIDNFWTQISLLTDCEMFYVGTDVNDSIDLVKYKNHVHDILSYYVELLKETRPLDNKMLVMLGIATYSYKRLLEVVDHELENTISGRSIVRSIIENYMMTKYLLSEEPNHEDIWTEFQYYGIGQYKLIYERYAEDKPTIKDSHVRFDYINILVSEYINKEFIDMDTRYFGSESIRNKFKHVNEDRLWKYYYDYDSSFEHGLWGAIRESSILKCSAPGHQYHGVPDIDNLQKMPSVAHDCVLVMNRQLEILKDQYGLPDTLKDDANYE